MSDIASVIIKPALEEIFLTGFGNGFSVHFRPDIFSDLFRPGWAETGTAAGLSGRHPLSARDVATLREYGERGPVLSVRRNGGNYIRIVWQCDSHGGAA